MAVMVYIIRHVSNIGQCIGLCLSGGDVSRVLEEKASYLYGLVRFYNQVIEIGLILSFACRTQFVILLLTPLAAFPAMALPLSPKELATGMTASILNNALFAGQLCLSWLV